MKAEMVSDLRAVLALFRSHRRKLRTSSTLGRLNEEFKRRTRVAGIPARVLAAAADRCGADGNQRRVGVNRG